MGFTLPQDSTSIIPQNLNKREFIMKILQEINCKLQIVEQVSAKTNKPYLMAIAHLPRDGKDSEGKPLAPIQQRFFFDEANLVRLKIKE